MAIEILFSVAVLLVFAKFFGEITERIKLSALTGEILGGLVVLVLQLVKPNELLTELAGIGLLLAVFLIGLQTSFERKDDTKAGALLGATGALLSFAAAFIFGNYVFGPEAGLVFGVALLSTSTAINTRTISDAGELHSKAGKMIGSINAADELISILALSTLVSYFTFMAETWKIAALFFLLLTSLLFIVAFLSKIASGMLEVLKEMNEEQFNQFIVAASLVIVFLLSYLTQNIGVAAATGAFAAGLVLSRSQLTEKSIIPRANTIGNGFFIPLFFAYAALFLDIASLYSSLWIIIALFVLTAAAKIIGCGLLSGYYGLRGREPLTVGISMVPRGEFSVIAAYIALSMKIITPQVYTIIVATVFLTMLITPLLFRAFLKQF